MDDDLSMPFAGRIVPTIATDGTAPAAHSIALPVRHLSHEPQGDSYCDANGKELTPAQIVAALNATPNGKERG